MAVLIVPAGLGVFSLLWAGVWFLVNWEMLDATDEDRRRWILEAQARADAEERAEKERRIAEAAKTAHAARIAEEARQSLNGLRQLSSRDFEKQVEAAFKKRNWETILCKPGADGGVDIWLHRDGCRAGAQCKRYGGVVGVKVVRELLGVLTQRGVPEGYIVTTGRCTDEARRFAAGTDISIIDERDVVAFLNGW